MVHRRFNFDDFDEQIRDALDSNSEGMADLLPIRQARPGEIGAVACRPSLLPDPPEAEVIDLNANVFDLNPPDGAA